MKPGDLVIDHTDNEIGLVVAIGPGLATGDDNYADGFMPSWKVAWPSLPGQLCDHGEDSLLCGDIEVVSEAR